jgi:uncharacterized protein YbaR (Trm112 family)
LDSDKNNCNFRLHIFIVTSFFTPVFMYSNFICPKCRNALNVDRHVVFIVEKAEGTRGLLLMSAELGDYSIRNNPQIEIEEGERLEFYCPLCQTRLNVHYHPNLVRVLMVDEQDVESQVLFSRIVGQKSTYLIRDGKVEPFGFESSAYLDALM